MIFVVFFFFIIVVVKENGVVDYYVIGRNCRDYKGVIITLICIPIDIS